MTRRELVVAAIAIAILASRCVLSWQVQALVCVGAISAVAAAWPWIDGSGVDDALDVVARIAGTSMLLLLTGLAVFLPTILVRAPGAVVLGAAYLAVDGALRHRRLRVDPPGTPAPRARVELEGTLHALGGDSRTSDVLWLARQGRRWWTSSQRVELRGEHGKVWIDPRGARPIGRSSGYGARTADGNLVELAGARPPHRGRTGIRWWTFREGDPAFVVGTVQHEYDPSAAALRDPPPVAVFAGDVAIGSGRMAAVLRRQAKARMLVWGAIAIVAAGLAAAEWLDWMP